MARKRKYKKSKQESSHEIIQDFIYRKRLQNLQYKKSVKINRNRQSDAINSSKDDFRSIDQYKNLSTMYSI